MQQYIEKLGGAGPDNPKKEGIKYKPMLPFHRSFFSDQTYDEYVFWTYPFTGQNKLMEQ